MANYNQKQREDEEERKRREAEAAAAAAAQQETQEPPKPAESPSTYRGIPKLNSQHRFEAKQNVAVNRTKTSMVQAGELDMLPENLEPRRTEFEEKNKAGRLGAAQTKQWSSAGNKIGVDVGSIKDVHQLAYFGTTLVSDKDRDAVYKKYAKSHNMNLDDLYYQAEQITGGKAFTNPKSNKAKLASVGLYNLDGTALDMNTAKAPEALRALRMVPDSNPYKAAAKKAYISEFGYLPDEEFAFMDSADLTEADYNKQVKAFGAAFTFSDGATEANDTAYLEMLDEIEYGYGDRNPWVKNQLKAELDSAYAERTGVYPPDENELRKRAEEAANLPGEDTGDGEKKPGFFKRLAGFVGDLFGGTEKAPKAEEPEAEEAKEQAEEEPTMRPGKYASIGVSSGGVSAPASTYAAAGSAPEVQGPAYQPQAAQEEEEPEAPAEVQGPAYQPQAQEQEEAPQESAEPKYVNTIPYDPNMTDAQALAYQKRGATLDPRNAAQIAWFVGNRNAMSIVSGYAPGFNTPSVMNNTEAKMHEAFSVYGQYGSEIGNAILSINNGSLPEEAQNIATLELGSVIDEIDRIVADPRNNITVPGKQNMYTYVLSLPEYEGLAARVSAVKDVQKQVNEAYAEQAQKEAEAKQTLVESAKARVLAGNATADDIRLIAEATTAADYIDPYDDEMYCRFIAQMNPMRANFFGDDKAFWKGDSAAAQEGMILRSGGAGSAGAYSTYKDELTREVKGVLDDYTETAIMLGMTLEDYLGAAGIDSLDQIADIAYNNMLAKGNAYRNDTQAQEAAEAIATSDVNSTQALLMGAEAGAKGYGADFAQTAYMALDEGTYNIQRMNLWNQYVGDYGYEQAAAMYYNDLMAHANSGKMDEASKKDLLDHMARATNIFDVAYEIDPTDAVTEFMRTTSYELSKDVDALDAIAQTMPTKQRWIFNATKSVANSLIGRGVSTVVGGVTGSAIVGSAVAYGTGEWANAYDENRAKGMSPGMAGRMALGNALLTTAVNMGGTGSQMNLFFGDDAYRVFRDATLKDGGMGMLKAMGGKILSSAHEEGMEEVAETILGKTYDLLDAEALAIDRGEGFSLSRTLRGITESLEESDAAALFREVVASYGMGAAMGGLFSTIGVTKTAVQAHRGANAQTKYQSIELANQLAEGKIPFTDENAGKAIAALQKDLEDPKFRRWIDSAAKAAQDQRATVTAILSGAGMEERTLAVKEAALATEHETKAAAATEAAEKATNRWIELRQQVASGDLSAVASLESARMLMGKANQAKHEATTAAQKARESSRLHMEKWLHEALRQSGVYKSQAMQMRANQITEARMQIAQRLAAQYEAEEAARLEAEAVSNAAAEEEIAYAEGQVFPEEEWTDEAEAAEVDAMTDEELDAEIDSIIQQESEAQEQVSEIENQREALGLTDEDVQEMTGEATAVSAERKNRIIAREKARFNNAFERMQTALENGDDDAADQITAEYDRTAERLNALGVNTDALIAEQYGYNLAEVNEAAEAAQEQETQKAETEKQERLTETLARKMQETLAKREQNEPARRYLMDHPIYVNASQAADILAAEDLKSISQVNRRYHMKLTTDESANAMPLDGYVMNDINAEAAGSVDEAADPVEELLRVMQTGKALAAEQKAQKEQAKELQAKRKAADKRRRESVDAIINPIDISAIPIEENVQKVAEMPMVVVLSGHEFELGGTTLKDDVARFFDSKGGTAKNPVLGDVQMTKRGAKASIGHKMNPRKAVAFAAIPDVIEKGEIVSAEKNWKGRGWDTFVIAAPIQISAGNDSGDYICGVIVKRAGGTQQYYVHDVILDSGVDSEQEKKAATVPTKPGHPDENGEAIGSTEQPSFYNVLERVRDVKRKNRKTGPVNGNIDAMASGGTTPAQTSAQRQAQRSKKLEGSALKSIQNLAKEMKVGLRVKSWQRFQSADYRPGKNVLGYYKNGQRNAIVRSAEAGRVSVTGHEIGHSVQEQIGLASNQQMIDSWKNTFGAVDAYTPQQYDHEAFAEFFWRYLTDRDAAVSYAGDAYVDTFEQALRQKKLSKSVSKAQAQVSAYMASETDAKVRSRMVDAYKSKDADDTAFARRVEIRLADDTAAAEDFQDVIRARKGEKHLSLEDNLRDTIRFNRRASARANECLTKNLVDQNGDVVGESLREALSDVKGKDFDLFWEYELAKHSLDRDTQKGQKNQVFDEDTLSTAERKAFVDKMDAEHPEFKQANDRFQKWRRLFMDTYLVNNGFLGANGSALMDALDAAYPNYVPTYRAKRGRGKAAAVGGRKYQMRTATGSTEDVINPFDSFVSIVNSIVQMTADNDSRKKFADLYDRYGTPMPGETGPGVGLFANEITQDMKKVSVFTESMREKITKMLDDIGTDPDVIMQIGDIIGDERVEYQGTGRVNMNNVITVRNEDGSKRYFEVYNPELFELLAATNTPNQAGVLDWIAKGTRMMSMLTTGSNPVFGMTNMMRDFQNSVNYGSWASNYVDGAVKWIGALWDVVRNGEASREYDSLGGGGWTAFDTKTKKGAAQIRGEVFSGKTIKDKIFYGYNTSNVGRIGKMAGRAIWSIATMEKLNEAIEKTSRLAEYKYGKHDRTTTEGRIEAFLASQDATTDFARKGNGQIARDLKNIVPFFNASMQGVYRTGRQLTGQESDRAGIRFAKTLVNTTLASALANGIMMAYLDDDEKEEFFYLSDDLKAKHMFLPNFAPEVFGNAALVRIPLNQDPVMYAINAAVTNFAWSGESDNEYVIEMVAVADAILDSLIPIGSTILDPAFSVLSNKNWYGSNIVPSYLQSYEATNQYTEETPTPFVELSKMFSGAGVKISPMMLQYVAEQYTGYIGQTLIPALPSEKNKGNILEGWLNALIVTARKRVTSDPLTSNDVVSTVYDSYNALNAVYKAGSSKRQFDIDYLNPALSERERRRAITEADDLIHSGGEIYEAKKEISAGYDKIDQINERDDLTDEEKHVLTQRIRKQMVETALDVQEIVEDYNVRYKYNGVISRWIAKMFIGEE